MNTIKKLSALAILAIFIISLVPMALAQQNGNNNLPIENNKPLEKAVKKAITHLEKATEMAGAQIENQERVIERVKEKIEVQEKNIERTQEKIEQIQARYQQTKERYQEAKQKYLGVKAKVNELRTEIQECVEGDCETKRKQFRVKSRDVLIHLSDVVLTTLDKLKEKIELSEMTEEEKTQALEDLEVQITEVQEAKAVLEGLSEDVTREEIKDAIKVIKDAWKTTKPQIKLGLGKVIGAKLGNIIVKTEQLGTKFNRIRDRLEADGYDVSALDSYLGEFNGKMTSAKEHWEMARKQFGEARTAEDVSAAVKEAHQHQVQARNLIKEARGDIRNIVEEIKGLNGLEEEPEDVEETAGEQEDEEIEEEEETTEEVEEELEEETGEVEEETEE